MSFRVEITESARADIEEIYLYIRNGSPTQAAIWRRKLIERVATLSDSPKRCPLAAESEYFDCEIRQLLFGIYRVLFTIKDRMVYILHVRHGARRPLWPPAADEE